MSERPDMTVIELLYACGTGTVHFAWFPVPVHRPYTYSRDGGAWLTKVRRLRLYGSPTYYFVRESDWQALQGRGDE